MEQIEERVRELEIAGAVRQNTIETICGSIDEMKDSQAAMQRGIAELTRLITNGLSRKVADIEAHLSHQDWEEANRGQKELEKAERRSGLIRQILVPVLTDALKLAIAIVIVLIAIHVPDLRNVFAAWP